MKEEVKESKSEMIKARGLIPIFYSTVSNTSKKLSFTLQEKLQNQSFLVTVTNIGDVDREQFLEMSGPAIFLLSTYGNGGSPADGEQFMEWLKSRKEKEVFSNIEFAVLGLGNRTFERFCGNSVSFREALLGGGGREMVQFVKCNSASNEQSAGVKFVEWSNNLVMKLKQKYEIKQMKVGEMLQRYKIIESEQSINSNEEDINKYQHLYGKQFLSYYKSFKTDVIFIKQLRLKNDGRSTLWIRINRPKQLKIEPGCNINIFPQNIRSSKQQSIVGSMRIESFKKKSKIPYPPMNIQQLWKISNFNQEANINLIKFAVRMSKCEQNIKSKYQQFIKNPQEYQKNPIRCWQLYQMLNPGLDFIVKLGINTVRPYTLASWDPQQKYIDLVVAIDPKGLTSKYLQSKPLHLRILPTVSEFYVPTGRPIFMIANGTGIAPFRSLAQHFMSGGAERPEIRLQMIGQLRYFGFQNRGVDCYFKDEWEGYQKQGKVVLRFAESRLDPSRKMYVQDLLKEDRNLITEHLFEKKGVIFICGSAQMGKAVQGEIFQAIKKYQKIPFKAFKLLTELQKNKTIVKQIFN